MLKVILEKWEDASMQAAVTLELEIDHPCVPEIIVYEGENKEFHGVWKIVYFNENLPVYTLTDSCHVKR